jgi:hypothetical protein
LLLLCESNSDEWRVATYELALEEPDEVKRTALLLSLAEHREKCVDLVFSRFGSGQVRFASLFIYFGWRDLHDHWIKVLPLLFSEPATVQALAPILGIGVPGPLIDCERLPLLLERLREVARSALPDARSLAYQFGEWIMRAAAPSVSNRVLELVAEEGETRDLLFDYILPHFGDQLSTDDLGVEPSIAYLRRFVEQGEMGFWRASPGYATTENFIRSVAYPLAEYLTDADERANLNVVLLDAGGRHGVRYRLLDAGILPASRRPYS